MNFAVSWYIEDMLFVKIANCVYPRVFEYGT